MTTTKKSKGKKKDKKMKKKDGLVIHLDDALLEKLDGRAEALAVSRAEFVRMAVAEALAGNAEVVFLDRPRVLREV